MPDPHQPLLEEQRAELIEEEREFLSLVDQAIEAGIVRRRPAETESEADSERQPPPA
jgi:hypothetical protein